MGIQYSASCQFEIELQRFNVQRSTTTLLYLSMSKLLRNIVSGTSPGPRETTVTPYGTPVDSTSRLDVSESAETDAVASEGRLASREGTIDSSSSSPGDQPNLNPKDTETRIVSHECEPLSSAANPDPTASTQRISQQKRKSRKGRMVNPQLVLENCGSVARDHLASERTFLAYVRTSLALASAGVALVQLFTIADLTSRSRDIPISDSNRQVQRFARPLGVTMVLFALIMLGTGAIHLCRSSTYLNAHNIY